MAQFYSGIDTQATGPLVLKFDLSEADAQAIFAMYVGTAAKITRERTVPDPTEDDPNHTKVETYQDARKLGEVLRDEVTTFIMGVCKRAKDYKVESAKKAAEASVVADEITPVEVKDTK